MSYARDTWLLPHTIATGQRVFSIIEDPSGVPNPVYVTVDEASYYLHDDTSFHATLPGLLYAIRKLLNDGTTVGVGTRTGTPNYSYTWEAVTPTSSTGIEYAGLKLNSSGGPFAINYAGGGTLTNMDGRWFGFGSANPGDVTSVPGVGLAEYIQSPCCARGRFVTHDLDDGIARKKKRIPFKRQNDSSPEAEDAITVIWNTGYRRRFVYADVPGALVFEHRSAQSAWAAAVGLHTTDQNHAWELIWDSFTEKNKLLVVHDSYTDLQVDTHDYEAVKLSSGSAWDAFFTETDDDGDRHTIDFVAWVDPDVASYDH